MVAPFFSSEFNSVKRSSRVGHNVTDRMSRDNSIVFRQSFPHTFYYRVLRTDPHRLRIGTLEGLTI